MQRLTFRFRYDENDLGRYMDVPCSVGKKKVVLSREEVDVLKKRAGSTLACMDANCAMREGEPAFGHPVHLAVFIGTAAYILDRLTDGMQPAHFVWYKHNDHNGIHLNDKVSAKTIIKKGLAEKTITLRPPKRVKRKHPVRVGQKHKRDPGAEGQNKTPLPYGAYRRALEAGLSFPLPARR
jgi:hypothetical protein